MNYTGSLYPYAKGYMGIREDDGTYTETNVELMFNYLEVSVGVPFDFKKFRKKKS